MILIKKIYYFLKNYWYIPFVLVLIVVFFLFGKKNIAQKLLKIAADSHKKQMEVVEKINKQENDRKKEAVEKYNETLNKLEEEYNLKREEIDKNKEKTIQKLISKDKEDLTELLAKEFGLTK